MSAENPSPSTGETDSRVGELEAKVAELTGELEKTRAERDAACSARDGLIREVLPFSGLRSEPRPSSGRRLILVMLVGLVALGAPALLLLHQRRALRSLTEEGAGAAGVMPRRSRRALGAAQPAAPVRPQPTAVVGAAAQQSPSSAALPPGVEIIPVANVSLVGRAALRADGQRVAVAGLGEEGASVILDLSTRSVRARLTGHRGAVRDIAFSPDGSRVVTGGKDGTVRLWEANTGKLIRIVRPRGSAVWAVAMSTQTIAVAADEPTVVLYPLDGGRPRALRGHAGPVRDVAFSPRGDLVASGGHDGLVRLWDPSSGALRRKLTGHRLWVSALAFSPDGSLLASSDWDHRLMLWQVATGTRVRELRGSHSRTLTDLAFDPRGETLASSSLDRLTVLWDVQSGSEQQVLEGHRWQVSSIAFAPDGRFLLSASTDGTLRRWSLPLSLPAVALALPRAGAGEVTLRNNTTGERLRLRLLGRRGAIAPGAAARLAAFLRCGADDKIARLDEGLVRVLDRVAASFGRDRELQIVSGFRSPDYNGLRTRQSRGVAKESQHLEGRAIDLRVAGVTITALRDLARSLRAGGVGFYPDSQFVHIDTGPVRYWEGK